MQNNKELKKQVLNILDTIPLARNCDITLLTMVWRTYYPNYLYIAPDGRQAVILRDLYLLPSLDHISRIRRKIQEDGKYLPTNSDVRKKRRIKEEEWREFLGYCNPGPYNVY